MSRTHTVTLTLTREEIFLLLDAMSHAEADWDGCDEDEAGISFSDLESLNKKISRAYRRVIAKGGAA